MRQKAKIHWLKDGDSNTYCFHSVVKERRGHNRIDFLKVSNGDIISTSSSIERLLFPFTRTSLILLRHP